MHQLEGSWYQTTVHSCSSTWLLCGSRALPDWGWGPEHGDRQLPHGQLDLCARSSAATSDPSLGSGGWWEVIPAPGFALTRTMLPGPAAAGTECEGTCSEASGMLTPLVPVPRAGLAACPPVRSAEGPRKGPKPADGGEDRRHPEYPDSAGGRSGSFLQSEAYTYRVTPAFHSHAFTRKKQKHVSACLHMNVHTRIHVS